MYSILEYPNKFFDIRHIPLYVLAEWTVGDSVAELVKRRHVALRGGAKCLVKYGLS
jgi:hypothetical protein